MNLWRRVLTLIALTVGLLLVPTPASRVVAQEELPPAFLRVRLGEGAFLSRIDGTAVLRVQVGEGEQAEVQEASILLAQGQPVRGAVQVPFQKGPYQVSLVGPDDRELVRVRGILIPQGPGAYEHTSVEATLLNRDLLIPVGEGDALVLEVGSVRGQVTLLFALARERRCRAEMALDTDGDDTFSDTDLILQQETEGALARVATREVDGLPLTSRVRARVWCEGEEVLGIEVPYDFANLQATSQPDQRQVQGQVLASAFLLRRVPYLTRVAIPLALLAPPPELVEVQPQACARDILSAFGEPQVVRSLLEDGECPSPAQEPQEAKEELQEARQEPQEDEEQAAATTPSAPPVAALRGWLTPLGLLFGVFTIAGLVALVLARGAGLLR